jgi:N,N'-diacetylchitobiose transport system substrate-binding protein
MNRARLCRLAAAASAAALALTGCVSGGGTHSGKSDSSLTVWMMTGGPGETPLMKDVNARFAKKHPGVKVHIEIQQWDNIVTKLTTALATGNPPDIVEMGNTQTALQSYSGGLADLTTDKSSFEDSAHWLTGLSTPSQYRGRLYAVPLYGGTKVVMYDKALFAAAGITSPPKTIAGIEKDCRLLRAKNASRANFSGFYMPGKFWFAGMPFVFGEGGDVAAQTGGRWKATMSAPTSVAGLKQWRTFQNTCSTKSSVGVKDDDPEQAQVFADGKAAMAYVRAKDPASAIQSNPRLKGRIGFFPMPGYTAGKTLPVIISGSTIGIAKNSPDKALAKDWLRVITSRSFQQEMAQRLNLLPVSTTFTPSRGITPQLAVAAQAAKNSRALPNSPGEATLETEGYNEQFFSKIAAGADIVKAAAEYDKHATGVYNSLDH